jgi:hypothetical protein
VYVSISLMIRSGLNAVTHKLAKEALVSSLSAILVMTIFSSVARPGAPSRPTEGRQSGIESGLSSGATNAAIKEFMERVALSHVASLKPAAPAASAIGEPSGPMTPTAVSFQSPAAPAPGLSKPQVRLAHLAASASEVLPPQSPLATIDATAVVAAPVRVKRLPPLQHAMRFVTDVWDSVPNTGTLVDEDVISVGDALTSLAKKL